MLHKKIDFLHAHEKFSDLIDALHAHKKKKARPVFAFLKYFLIFILIIFVLSAVLAGILFFQVKGFYDLAIAGRDHLQNSITAARQNDFAGMAENSAQAEDYFSRLAAELEALHNNALFKNLKIGDQELNDIDYLAKSAGTVSKSLNEAAVIGQKLNDVLGGKFGANFAQFSAAQKQALLKFLYESGPEINGLKADLDLALLNMDKVAADGWLAPFQGKIADAKNKLAQADNFLSQASLAAQLLPELAGYPEQSTYLVLFENNDELRPTGGFLGTYGILQASNGDIVRFDSHDIYHLDEPMEANHLLSIVPPDPIKKYLNQSWYMRDSNWSPDWPTSARQITWFYGKENNLLPPANQINNFSGNFSGVIAVTPDLVTSLLALTGPVTVNGEEFNQDNFTNLLQYKVEQDLSSQNVSSWQRKEIIGKILAEMKTRLFNLDYRQWPALLEKLNQAVAEKNLLVYFPNAGLESLTEQLGAGGEIKQTGGDYFLLVDANMAALKTDAVMKRNINYQLVRQADGLHAKVKITYQNTGKADWRTSDYKTYTRLYVPHGSQLVKADGFINEPAKVYDEAGKTVIAGYLVVRLGKTGELNLDYILPKNLADAFDAGNYSLFLAKQPGNRIQSVKVDVTAPSAIKSYNPLTNVIVNGNKIDWSSDLATDKEFSINF